jgi:hypothetical protein
MSPVPPRNVRHRRSTNTPRRSSEHGFNEFKPRKLSPSNANTAAATSNANPSEESKPSHRPSRISKRTSLSSLAETGFVAPPTPVTMRYHNAIPARASLFMRSRSRHHSREEIPPSPSMEGSPYEQKRSSIRRSRHGSLASSRRGTVYGMLKISQDSSDAGEHGMNGTPGTQQLVTDIDGLMDQLSSVKRRLSQRILSVSPSDQLNEDPQQNMGSPYRRTFSALSEEGLLTSLLSFLSRLPLFREHPHHLFGSRGLRYRSGCAHPRLPPFYEIHGWFTNHSSSS